MNIKWRLKYCSERFHKETQKKSFSIIFPILSSLILGKSLKCSGRGWVIFSIFIIFSCYINLQVHANTGDTISLTGSTEEIIETNSGAIQPPIVEEVIETSEIPDFKIIFQNPSYVLEREEQRADYTCDTSKTECKINFKLQTLDDKDISSKFICSINFGFESDQSGKCNPNTVIFPEGNTNVVFRISDKNDATNFKEKTLLIKKEILQTEENTNTGTLDTNTGSIHTGSGEIGTSSGITTQSGLLDSGTGIEIPELSIEIQSGLEYSGTGNIWKCKKEDCKVNLTAEHLFTGSFQKNYYECKWDFGGGTFTTESTDKKCNPGYVTYNTGSFIIALNFFEKGNQQNQKNTQIVVHNGISVEIKTGTGESISDEDETSSGTTNTTPGGGGGGGTNSSILLKEITIQSGLDEKSECNQEKCKINLQYENTSKETCEWNFGTAEFNEKYLTTCNPGFIYLSDGIHKISVKIFENNILKGEKYLEGENIFLKIRRQNNLPPRSEISLQGKLSEGKFLVDNGVVCREVEKCYLNFTGEGSSDPNNDKLEFSWNLGNGVLFDDDNPKGVWYYPGKYSISLKVTDIFGISHESFFSVEVIGKQTKDKKVEQENKQKLEVLRDVSYFKNLKIKSVLVNPKGKDSEGEYIELENIGISSINLKGVTIDDIREKGSKPFTIEDDTILGAFQSKKIYRTQTKIALNNTADEVYLGYYGEPLDSISWDFSVPDDYILTKKDTEFLEYEVMVLRVIDGDTILIQFVDEKVEKLRLVGVDTPETKHPKKPVEFFGKEASNFTKQMLEGKTVLLKQSIKNYKDKYNRLLGYIYIPGEEEIFFNKLLIEQGYARAYLRFPFEYSIDFKKAENKAKREKLGMWVHNDVRKQIRELVKQEKKLVNESVRSYKTFKSLDDIQIGKIIGSVRKIKKNFYHNLGDRVGKQYNELSIVWGEENAEKRKKELKKEKKNNTQIVQLTGEIKNKKIPFTKVVTKQKKSLKISGKTFPSVKVVISGMQDDIVLYSDDSGKYEIKIHIGLKSGEYNLSFFVEDDTGELFAINRDKEIVLEEEYLQNMRRYYIPKAVSKKGKQKIIESKKDNSILESSLENQNSENTLERNIRILVANIFTTLIVFFLIFLILRKEKII